MSKGAESLVIIDIYCHLCVYILNPDIEAIQVDKVLLK